MRIKCSNCILSLGERTRIEIYSLLSQQKKMAVSDLVKELKVNQPTVSHHLQVLSKMGLIKHERKGKYKYFFLSLQCPYYKKKCILQS